MSVIIIGVDPHKASHTAVAIDGTEAELGARQVRASRRQVEQLLGWAEPFESRRWAIESANGLGYLLSQQLVAAGEHVVDVPATLVARTGVGHRPIREDRSQRRLVGRDHGAAPARPA